MKNSTEIEKQFSHLGQDLIDEIFAVSVIKDFPGNTDLIKPGQYVRVVPVVLSGLVKVFTRYDDKELLLYYIQPKESCIMSFSACLTGAKSKIHAVTEEESNVILIPSDKLAAWVTEFPAINKLFYQQFDLRYTDLLDTINRVFFDKLDKRLLDYLSERAIVKGNKIVKISHREIAGDLGTAREVISRLIKKLEHSGEVKQHRDGIEIL
jgi:CRP/FNR family transcriptional regulator